MMSRLELSPFDAITVIQTTKKIVLESEDATKLNAQTLADWGRAVGFQVIEASDGAYGGMNFFVVLERPSVRD